MISVNTDLEHELFLTLTSADQSILSSLPRAPPAILFENRQRAILHLSGSSPNTRAPFPWTRDRAVLLTKDSIFTFFPPPVLESLLRFARTGVIVPARAPLVAQLVHDFKNPTSYAHHTFLHPRAHRPHKTGHILARYSR
ncbi:hypothetical protein D1P53_002886 [Cryptococcus gattii VGV]|nr:hypothetical protein D1P53_002886 [Cryptococcus gattii VGV]